MTAVIAERASSLAKRSVSRVYRVRHAKRADMKYPTSAGKKNPDLIKSGLRGDPTEVRTRVTAVKGRCLRPLDHRAVFRFI